MSSTTFNKDSTGAEVVAAFAAQVKGKTIAITGTSAKGLGAQTAIDLSRGSPAHLILLARSLSKVQPVMDAITQISPNTKTTFVPVSLDDMPSVRTAAGSIVDTLGPEGKVDILINNAGIMATPWSLSKQGIEAQFATNHIGHFILTQKLMPLIKRAGPDARVVNLSSDGYKIGTFRGRDYNFNDGKDYDMFSGYGQSKTANVLFSQGLAKRGVHSFSVHPGVIYETELARDMADMSAFARLPELTKKNTGLEFEMGQPKSIEQGVATTIRAALDPSLVSDNGAYLVDCQVEELAAHGKDSAKVEQLWEISEELVGEKFEI